MAGVTNVAFQPANLARDLGDLSTFDFKHAIGETRETFSAGSGYICHPCDKSGPYGLLCIKPAFRPLRSAGVLGIRSQRSVNSIAPAKYVPVMAQQVSAFLKIGLSDNFMNTLDIGARFGSR